MEDKLKKIARKIDKKIEDGKRCELSYINLSNNLFQLQVTKHITKRHG